jgi:glycosyltransferase involved in cell wall biosynthesis
MSVDVVSLKEHKKDGLRDSVNGVAILRVPLSHWRGSKLGYAVHYGLFTLGTMLLLGFRSIFKPYSLVHVHNMPDFLVFSAAIPKLLGAKVILDLHDPMPELMMTIYGLSKDSFYVRLMKEIEKWSTRFADRVITANAAFERLFVGRGCDPGRLSVVLNSPDEGIFEFRDLVDPIDREREKPRSLVIMYHGAIVERHGLDLAVLALGSLRKSIPQIELRVYGFHTPFLDEVMDLARQKGLEKSVQYHGVKSLEQISKAIDECHVGIIPNRQSTFTEINFPTRILEYLARAKPVIAPRTEGIQDYFGPEDLIYFELGDAHDLARKILWLHEHPLEVNKIVKNGQAVYRVHTWSQERSRLWALVSMLFSGGNGVDSHASPETAHPGLMQKAAK